MRHSHLDDAFTHLFFLQSCKFGNHKLLGMMAFCSKSLVSVSLVSCLLEFASNHVFCFEL